METRYCVTPDEVRIAYDVQGAGLPLILLHGGGGLYDRWTWHKAGYVKRLQDCFTVITMDIRGNGESDRPKQTEAYAIEKICADVFAVAEDCHIGPFVAWGYSYGANIVRYLAAEANRVTKAVLVGAPFGPAVTPAFDAWIKDYLKQWKPFIEAQARGELDLSRLPNKDRKVWTNVNVECWYFCLQAMAVWHSISPKDLQCPYLVLVGTKNKETYHSLLADQATIQASGGQLMVLEGLTHPQEFNHLDAAMPHIMRFLQGSSSK